MIKISHLNIFFILILIFQVPISFSYAQVKIDVNKISDKNICQSATFSSNSNIIKWHSRSFSQKYVKEAKLRGLDCGVKTSDTSQSSLLPPTSGLYSHLSDSVLCDRSVLGGYWQTRTDYLPYVQAAKKRGLNCGLTNDLSIVSNWIVCDQIKNNAGIDWVKESNNRGLDCGVKDDETERQAQLEREKRIKAEQEKIKKKAAEVERKKKIEEEKRKKRKLVEQERKRKLAQEKLKKKLEEQELKTKIEKEKIANLKKEELLKDKELERSKKIASLEKKKRQELEKKLAALQEENKKNNINNNSSYKIKLPSEWIPFQNKMSLQQEQFCQLTNRFFKDMDKAISSRNDIRVNMVHRDRQENMDGLIPSGKINNWIFKVIKIEQVEDGSAAVVLKLQCKSFIGSGQIYTKSTWIKKSNKQWRATIPYNDRRFRELAKLGVNDFILGSGTLLEIEAFKPGQIETFYASQQIGEHPLTKGLNLEGELFIADLSYIAALN